MTGKRVLLAAVVAGAIVSVLVGGCGGSPSKPKGSSATPASASPSDPTSTASADALAAYNGMMADWVEVAKTSNYQDPALASHASGAALSRLIRIVAAAKAAGVVSKGQPVDTAKVTQLLPSGAPTQAVLVGCADDTNWLQYKTDGRLVPGSAGGRHHVDVQVESVAGVWKVTKFTFQPVGTC